tara:strand:+ start:674 stop:823 length:150 start_codon:yes stop_codon:yes gene_type:complete
MKISEKELWENVREKLVTTASKEQVLEIFNIVLEDDIQMNEVDWSDSYE